MPPTELRSAFLASVTVAWNISSKRDLAHQRIDELHRHRSRLAGPEWSLSNSHSSQKGNRFCVQRDGDWWSNGGV